MDIQGDTRSDTKANRHTHRNKLSFTEREVARLISQVECGHGDNVLSRLPARAINEPFIIGITGAPGSGKSTLVDKLIQVIRKHDKSVAVLAIDPSSHITGGAMLGDRVRMSSRSSDPGTFIRSMGSRGSTTGLAPASRDAISVLGAANYDVVIIETVGVGQVELDVLSIVDTVALVLVPGLGDSLQMNKAGIMEIGDVFIVNMADRPETPTFVRDLKQSLSISFNHTARPLICQTNAITGDGVDHLWNELHDIDINDRSNGSRAQRRLQQQHDDFIRQIENKVQARTRNLIYSSADYRELNAQLHDGRLSVGSAAKSWLRGLTLQHTSNLDAYLVEMKSPGAD